MRVVRQPQKTNASGRSKAEYFWSFLRPVFISYSHADKNFVDKLAAHLTLSKVHVWVDRWELHVGDSLITKIQQIIQEASALIVILSHASV